MGGKKKKDKKEEVKEEAPVKKLPTIRENWVQINFKLIDWRFMNFSMKFKENTRIFTIKRVLQERHGRMDDLRLCFHAFSEANEIQNEMMTLLECGIKGQPIITDAEIAEMQGNIPEGETLPVIERVPVVNLFYDFKPTKFSDPILLYFK
eukprot:gene9054-12212_t